MTIYFTIGLVFAVILLFIAAVYALQVFYYCLKLYIEDDDENAGYHLLSAQGIVRAKYPLLHEQLDEGLAENIYNITCWAVVSIVIWPILAVYCAGWAVAFLIKRKTDQEDAMREEKTKAIIPEKQFEDIIDSADQACARLNGGNNKFYGRWASSSGTK